MLFYSTSDFVHLLMIALQQSFGQISLDSPSDKEHTISLSELDARLHILERAEKSTAIDSPPVCELPTWPLTQHSL